MMFHYRWGPEEGVENASKILPLWNLTVPDEMVLANTGCEVLVP
jgi:hypothetical protein